jgi:hypothetical protein
MSEILKISNSWQVWLACSVLIIVVLTQVTRFIVLCRKEAVRIDYDPGNLNKAIKTGAFTAIGPALAGIVIMISMMAVLGTPITWQRLSVIGSAQSEMMVAGIAATAEGVTLGGADYAIGSLTLAFFLMAFTGCGWLLTTTIFTGSMEKVRGKLSGGDVIWLGLLSAGATIGIISYMSSVRLVAGLGSAAAVITGFAVQFLIDKLIAPRWNKIKGYSLGIALICAMIVAYLVQPV